MYGNNKVYHNITNGQDRRPVKIAYFSLIDTANPPHGTIFIFSTLLLVTIFFVMV